MLRFLVFQVRTLRRGLRLNLLRRLARGLNIRDTVDRCEGWTYNIGLESHVLQIEMNLEYTLYIDLSHVYCRSM